MQYVPIPNTVKVELVYSWDSQVCENVFHVKVPGEINTDLLDSIQGTFYSWYSVSLAAMQSNTVSFVKFILSDASTQYGISKEYGPGVVNAGLVSNNPSLPNNVSVAMKWNTGLRGRSFRGRTFHVGLTESMVVGNNVTTDTRTYLLSTYAGLLSVLDAQGWQLVVASKFQGNAPRTTGLATEILTVTTDGVVDSQRRRLPGRGS